MDHISNLVQNHAQTELQECRQKQSSEHELLILKRQRKAWTDALMTKFGAIYGAKWHDNVIACGGLDSVTAEWQHGLSGLSGEQIKRAIEHCRINHAWPPSIAEFRAAATDNSTPEQRAFRKRLADGNAAMRALPKETWAETRARGAARLAELIAMLEGRTAKS